jgi:tetratricopeptide (TPR) repeat protein
MKKIIILMIAAFLGMAQAQESKKDDVDYIALAALLMRDGHVERAADALREVDTSDEKIDLIQYYTLKGLVDNKQEHYRSAIENFEKAIEAGQEDKNIYLYIAQDYFKLKEYDNCIGAMDRSGELGRSRPQLFAMRADCHWKMARHDVAMETIAEGQRLFGDYADFYKQRFYYLVALNLYQEALEDANKYLQMGEPDAKTYVTLIASLRRSGAVDKALVLSEKANLEFADNAEITVLLGHLYIDKGMTQAAADLFDEASKEEYKYTKESSEMFRRAKEFILALYKNSQILDQKEKLKQRLAIFLEFGDYERAAAMHDAMERNGLYENEDLRYAIAYSYYMIGEHEASEAQLKLLSRPDLFAKATELRKNMEKCQNNRWECE